MSIRRVSDLPEVSEINEANQSRVDNSLFELSYLRGKNEYTYDSNSIKMSTVKDFILQDVMKGNSALSGDKTFLGHCDFLSSVCVSGNFLLNEGSHVGGEFEDYSQFSAIINVGYTNINSNYNTTIDSGRVNTIKAGLSNVIMPNLYIDNGEGRTFAEFSDILTVISSDQVIIKSPAIHFDGDTYFSSVINGCALCARYADLAELYESDQMYKPGTLVEFGGDKEITLATTNVNAVITTQPGLILGNRSNDGIWLGIAMSGRVPVLVDGVVQKFDKIVLNANKPGYGKVDNAAKSGVIGIALKDKSEQTSTVECVVKLTF